MSINRLFADRVAAGQALARELSRKAYVKPVVLALPRGGVPVAAEVAKALKAPLDLILVRKIGVPSQPELALAAIVNGDSPEIVINEDVRESVNVSDAQFENLKEKELAELERRREVYLAGRPRVPVEGTTAIVVDDGIATGATMRAALKAIRRRHPKHLVLAVPVAPRDTLSRLASEVDEVVCLKTPEYFFAISAHYGDFAQVNDEEVARALKDSVTS